MNYALVIFQEATFLTGPVETSVADLACGGTVPERDIQSQLHISKNLSGTNR